MGRVLAVIIWIITLLSVLLFVSGKWWFPTAISDHAPALDRQFMITILVVGLSFTAAQIGLGWMVWKALHGLVTLGELALIYAAFNQGQGLMRTLLENAGQLYGNSLFL